MKRQHGKPQTRNEGRGANPAPACQPARKLNLNWSEAEQELGYEAIRLAEPASQKAFLDRACEGNPTLRRRIDEFLMFHAKAEAFFASAQLGTTLGGEDIPQKNL